MQKKVDKKPEEVQTAQHLAENLDRKLQAAFDLFRTTTTAFSRFKIQFLFKQKTEEKNIQITVGKHFYLKPKSMLSWAWGARSGTVGLINSEQVFP